MKRILAARAYVRGQAMAEAVLALAALGLLFVLQAAVARLQDLALHTQFGARQAAFALVQGVPDEQLGKRVDAALFHAPHQRWGRIDGGSMLSSAGSVNTALQRHEDDSLPAAARLGAGLAPYESLARELLPGPRGLVTGTVTVSPGLGAMNRYWPGLRGWQPRLSARFAILDGAGHARDDGGAQARIAASDSAWGRAARGTVQAGRVASVLKRLDEPWHRPALDTDWLGPWAGLVPGDLPGGTP